MLAVEQQLLHSLTTWRELSYLCDKENTRPLSLKYPQAHFWATGDMCSVRMTTLQSGFLWATMMHIKDVYHDKIRGSVMCIVLCRIP